MPSRIRKYNFCSHEHRAEYQKSTQNKSFGKGWKHTPEEIEKIRQANLSRNYNVCFTQETRKKLADGARKKVWTRVAKENARNSHLGIRLTEEHKQKIRENAPRGWKNKMWKGRYAGYTAKHMWAAKYLKKPKICIFSNTEGHLCAGRLERANKNHENRKNFNDWDYMCKYHHDKYDFEHGMRHLTKKTEKIYQKFGNTKLKDFSIDGIIIDKNINTNFNYL